MVVRNGRRGLTLFQINLTLLNEMSKNQKVGCIKKVVLMATVKLICCISSPLYANDLRRSATTDSWDNPFIAFGYNPQTDVTTGYLVALRTSPGRTDECKLVFASDVGKRNMLAVRYATETAVLGKKGLPRKSASLIDEKNISYVKFVKKNMGGNCDWVLPFVLESEVPENPDEVVVAMEAQNPGDWIAVYAIGVKKARFHSRPDSSTVQKSFLVEGDLIFVYEEQPNWYLVKYNEGKKKAERWIRKSDTLQP